MSLRCLEAQCPSDRAATDSRQSRRGTFPARMPASRAGTICQRPQTRGDTRISRRSAGGRRSGAVCPARTIPGSLRRRRNMCTPLHTGHSAALSRDADIRLQMPVPLAKTRLRACARRRWPPLRAGQSSAAGGGQSEPGGAARWTCAVSLCRAVRYDRLIGLRETETRRATDSASGWCSV